MASAFWRSKFPEFSRIFRKLEVKATNCHAFYCSIRSELDRVTVTQRVEPTAATKLRSPVTMGPSRGRDGVGYKKRGEKSGKHRPRVAVFSTPFDISFIMRTQSTFSWPSSLVLANGDHSMPLGCTPLDIRSLRAAHLSIEVFRA